MEQWLFSCPITLISISPPTAWGMTRDTRQDATATQEMTHLGKGAVYTEYCTLSNRPVCSIVSSFNTKYTQHICNTLVILHNNEEVQGSCVATLYQIMFTQWLPWLKQCQILLRKHSSETKAQLYNCATTWRCEVLQPPPAPFPVLKATPWLLSLKLSYLSELLTQWVILTLQCSAGKQTQYTAFQCVVASETTH
jgi:hypothetical protein